MRPGLGTPLAISVAGIEASNGNERKVLAVLEKLRQRFTRTEFVPVVIGPKKLRIVMHCGKVRMATWEFLMAEYESADTLVISCELGLQGDPVVRGSVGSVHAGDSE